VETLSSNGSRAAQAAARVAARYAKAPSYSEMQAAEARTAVRAAEIATQVALEAQAAAEAVLADLDAASAKRQKWEQSLSRPARPEPVFLSSAPAFEPPAPPQVAENLPLADGTVQKEEASKSEPVVENHGSKTPALGILWEPDMPVRQAEPSIAHAQRGTAKFEIPMEDWWEPAPRVDDTLAASALEPVEPAQPIFANLIEFPRELVATRKARPRLAEGPHVAAGAADGQLSIFEVDPGTISIEPEIVEAATVPIGPEWSGMELDAQPLPEPEAQEEPGRKASTIELAPISRRLLAAVVDGTLIVGAFLAVVFEAASHLEHFPALKQAETSGAVALLGTAILYLVVFSTLTASTPGMRYAGISLCTFDDEFPTRSQRCSRLGALLLSLLPMGLGIMWGLFDEEHLSWHDRLSQTYQRKC
jgi:uncharacterized RDD family membrane protein YckC